MQKVEGSSPFIRSSAKPRNRGALVSQGHRLEAWISGQVSNVLTCERGNENSDSLAYVPRRVACSRLLADHDRSPFRIPVDHPRHVAVLDPEAAMRSRLADGQGVVGPVNGDRPALCPAGQNG
jgi:hypothetical protein